MNVFSALILSLSLIVMGACLPTKNADPVIVIDTPYAFATAPNAKTGAAFMVIHNNTEQDDKLISAQSDVAEFTEIHENMIDPDDGTMMMRKIRALDIPAGEKVILEPKGYHIMFIKMKQSLNVGDMISLTLNFEKMGEKNIDVKIVPPGIIAEHTHHH